MGLNCSRRGSGQALEGLSWKLVVTHAGVDCLGKVQSSHHCEAAQTSARSAMAALLALGRERTQHPPETLSAPVFARGFKLLMFPSSVGLLDKPCYWKISSSLLFIGVSKKPLHQNFKCNFTERSAPEISEA